MKVKDTMKAVELINGELLVYTNKNKVKYLPY